MEGLSSLPFPPPSISGKLQSAGIARRRPVFSLSPMHRPLVLFAALALQAPLLSGCANRYIPNTDVEDSSDNRKIITFCERYRHAVERRNVGELLSLVSPDYYEDGGNIDASDDLDFAGLKDYLTNEFQDVKAIRYEIRYRRIVREDDVIYVDYTYSASYRIPSGKGDEWRRKVEENRLEIVPHQDKFLIVAGM